jgi:hypothetical protein
LFAAAPPAALTPAQAERSKEQARLNRRAAAAVRDGRPADAVPLVRRSLAIEREVFGAVRGSSLDTLEWLAYQLEQQQEFPEAIRTFEEVVLRRENLQGKAHWQAIDARWLLADARRAAQMSLQRGRKLARAR